MPWAAAALVGSAVVGGIASSNAAGKAADAANNAALMQQAGANQSINAQQTALDKQIALNQPWQDAGLKALSNYANNPAFSFSYNDMTADPSYQFRLQQGADALDQSASARGNLLSGGQAKAMQSYGQNMASQEYGNAYNRALQNYNTNANTQLNLANIGRGAAGQTQNALVNNANNVSSTYMNNANNQAAQQNAIGTAQANGVNGIATSINNGVANALYAYGANPSVGGGTPSSGTASNLNPAFNYSSITPLG